MNKKIRNTIAILLIIGSIVTGLHIKNTAEEQSEIEIKIQRVQSEMNAKDTIMTNLEHNMFEENKELDRVTADKTRLEEEFEETGDKELIGRIDEKNGIIGYLKESIEEKSYQLIDTSSDKQGLYEKKQKLEEELE